MWCGFVSTEHGLQLIKYSQTDSIVTATVKYVCIVMKLTEVLCSHLFVTVVT
jgi:hypothetical protein